jgi:putative flavoprotein involved in K+ transport
MSATTVKYASEAQAVELWLDRFGAALERRDVQGALDLFESDECFWRDLAAFTWNIKTSEGGEQIGDMLRATLAGAAPCKWTLDAVQDVRDDVITARVSFETRTGRANGVVRLRNGRCWTLLTVLTELKGHEEKTRRSRKMGVSHGLVRDRRTWLEEREHEAATLGRDEQPYCLIVGGGQGGIGLAARLKRLSVPTIVLERRARPGDTWRSRYRSLCLHDPVWYDHLPYLPFPDDWPVFMAKDKLADWLEAYVSIMEINYWGSSECASAQFDEKLQEWVVTVRREGEELVLRPKQLVFALGVSGYPSVPKIEGADAFEGRQLHSSAYASAADYLGERVVVIGSNNSAHDICADLWESGVDVTMVQRSPTTVVRSQTLVDMAWAGLYSEAALDAGITTEIADLLFASMPSRVAPRIGVELYEAIAKRDAQFYDRLRKAGFLLDFGEDGSGLQVKYLRRGSGYYIDVGASELIANGDVKLRAGVQPIRIKTRSIELSDGANLPADAIIYATGFGPMSNWLSDLVSKEVAEKVGLSWGLGSSTARDPGPWEGELRNMWKPTQQKNLWFHGGNLNQSRFYSRTLALMLKARMEGIETPVYGLQEVHHRPGGG